MSYFDRFDICEAFFLFAADYHGGQWSPEYEIFGRLDKIGFRPSPLLRLETASENVKAIYGSLVRKVVPYGWKRRALERGAA